MDFKFFICLCYFGRVKSLRLAYEMKNKTSMKNWEFRKITRVSKITKYNSQQIKAPGTKLNLNNIKPKNSS